MYHKLIVYNEKNKPLNFWENFIQFIVDLGERPGYANFTRDLNEGLKEHNCKFVSTYGRGKGHLAFRYEEDATAFVLKWS